MKIIIISITLFISQLAFANAKNEFNIDQDEYSIKLSSKEVTTSMGLEYLTRYSVYENGRFVHSGAYGGRFFSCRKDKPQVKPIKSETGQIGWIIIGYGICGNTVSNNIELVIPVKEMWGSQTLYMNKTFISKQEPILKPTKNGAEVWFYEQNWGNGGTATSIFVPRKLLVSKKDYSSSIRKGDILENIDFLESRSTSDWLKPHFISLFVAGIEDANPQLMSYAINKYYKKEDKEWYEVFVKDGSIQGVRTVLDQVKSLRSLYEDVQGTVSWDFNLNKNSL
jgi:hypothetical protein